MKIFASDTPPPTGTSWPAVTITRRRAAEGADRLPSGVCGPSRELPCGRDGIVSSQELQLLCLIPGDSKNNNYRNHENDNKMDNCAYAKANIS